MKLTRILAIGILAICVASCCSCRKGRSKTAMPLIGTTWQVVQMEGNAFTTNGENYTVQFTDDFSVTGMGDCNRIMGSFESLSDSNLTLRQMATTRMLCPNQYQETKFIQLLEQTQSYTIDGDNLMLFNNGELKLVLKALK